MRGHVCFDRHVRSCLLQSQLQIIVLTWSCPGRTHNSIQTFIPYKNVLSSTKRPTQLDNSYVEWVEGKKSHKEEYNNAKPQTPAVAKCCIYIQLPSLAVDCVIAQSCTCHSALSSSYISTFDRKGIT